VIRYVAKERTKDDTHGRNSSGCHRPFRHLALGDRRASVVREYLASLGVGSARVKTVSYGKERPFCSEENEHCWQENRQGHLVITAK
jgi:outer membrane protein OmpA-like peptidoglycan-associated protein